ncbi:hypothetical protein [Arthrobacter roseus]|uniref:hypothetical protein n=1 Tax=Arthrobacter roseus TaxID=136274 RepID=UPI0019647B1B|nr:hypothetical protein [Arthrobacter roseus]MBM7846929.1 uncharacterized protein YacL [Arthrobacter roseus]
MDIDPQRPVAVKHLPWKKILFILLAIHALVVGFSLVSPLLTGMPRGQTQFSVYFDVNYEGNFPTWWSVVQLSGATVFLAITACFAWYSRSRGWIAWSALAALMLVLNLDEGTWLHERFDQIALHIVDVQDFTFVWLIFGIPLALIILVVSCISARHLPLLARKLVLAGFVTLMFAAVGMELIAGSFIQAGTSTVWIALSYHLEEFLELAAVALILVAPLTAYRLRPTMDGVSLQLEPKT